MLLTMTAPTKERTPDRDTKPTGRKEKYAALDRRVNSMTWSGQVFRTLGKNMPGRGRGPRLADTR